MSRSFQTPEIRGLCRAMKRRGQWEGWRLVGWTAVLLTVMSIAILMMAGTGEDGVRMIIRATARSSFGLFIAAFIASSLVRLWPSSTSKWILRNRRYLGVSFALSHAVHLAAIIEAVRIIEDFKIGRVTLIGGGLAYVFIAAMTVTSFDRTAAWLGRRWWVRLHKVGSYYVWGIFASSYIGRATQSLSYVPVAAILIAAVGLRIATSRPRVRIETTATQHRSAGR